MRCNLGLRAIAALALLASAWRMADAGNSAAIFMYHHVDDSTPPSTSVSPDMFALQLDYLEREGFVIRPLLELIEALAADVDVPDRSVAITFDDGYSSIVDAALPELVKRGWPFTVFVNTDAVDGGYGAYLSWDDLRVLGRAGGTIGNHSASHAHLVRHEPEESDAGWRSRVDEEIEKASLRLAAEVGDYTIPVFAYPYGEYTTEIEQIVADHGLYGVGQQSGAFGADSDFLALPRYPVASDLESLDEFGLRARSRPLPIRIVGPEQHVLDRDQTRPPLGLALLDTSDVRTDALTCYASGQGRMTIEWRSEREFVAIPAAPLPAGRSKYNCTAPSRTTAGVYYWYGHLWMKKRNDGNWYSD